MRIALFGATGPTGRQLLDQALAAGHQVTAAVRRPDALAPRPGLDTAPADHPTGPTDHPAAPADHPTGPADLTTARARLTVVRADVTDADAVSAAIAGADAVLSTLGVRYTRAPVTVYSTGTAHIVAGMRAHGVRRLAVVSSGMVAARRPSGPLLQRRLLDPLLRHGPGRTVYQDMIRMERLLAGSGLDWTVLRPSALVPTDRPGDYTIAEDFADWRFTGRADLAAGLLAQLTDDRFVGKVAALVSPHLRERLTDTIRREARNKP
jgi:putative NADH-flavin reductase